MDKVRRGLVRGSYAPPLLLVFLLAAATIVVLEAGARVVLHGSIYWVTDRRVEADGYAGAAWTRDYYREFLESGDVDWHPFVYWRRRPYSGTFINIDDRGIRRTWTPPGLPAEHPQVFVFGGSPVWGTGVRDDHTAPSRLARALAQKGSPAEVVNYGESGYVTRQAADMLITELVAGRVPDVVVFQSGVEDTFSALQSGEAGLPQNEDNRRAEFNAMQPEQVARQGRFLITGLELLGARLRARFVRPQASGVSMVPPTLAADVIARFCATAVIVAALGDRYGFRPLFYWQPVVFLKRQQTEYERSAAQQYGYASTFFADVYRRREERACPGIAVHDLGPAIHGGAGPLFIDAFHLTEEGNDRVALEMLPGVSDALRRAEAIGHP